MPCPRRKRRLVIAVLCGVFLCALAAHGSVGRVFRVLSSAKYSWAEASSSSSSSSFSSSFTNSSPTPSASASSWSSSSLRAQGQLRDVKEDNRKKKPAHTKGDPPQAKKPPGVHHNPANSKLTRNNNPYSFHPSPFSFPPPPPPPNTSSSRLFTTPARSPHPHQSSSSLTTSKQRQQQQQASNLKPHQPPPPPKPSPAPPRKANLSSASSSRRARPGPHPHLASSRRVKIRDILYPTEVSHVLRPFPSNPLQLFSGYNVSGESPALLGDLYQRYLRVEKACSAVAAASAGTGAAAGAGVGSEKRGRVAGIFKDDASRVAYCYLPKAGCTFWIRVFSYLHNFTGDSPKSPWDIPRLKLHNNPNSHGVLWSVLREGIHDHLRFMFVRHPFSRLWSAYVDKFFLPDFWQIGTQAVRKLRGAGAALSPRSAGCGSDVTFPEFVAFSLSSDEPHWAPIYLRCDPCLFKPAVVGSMKTFSRDNLFLLRRMGLEWVLKDVDPDSQKEKEIATLITYNFERIHSIPFYRPCVNDSELTRLLWKAFQINGYIPDDAPLPALSAAAASSSSGAGVAVRVREFQGQVLGVFRAAWPRRRELRLQKERYLRQALASLPPRLMAKVKRKYMPDMVYFGFNDTNF